MVVSATSPPRTSSVCFAARSLLELACDDTTLLIGFNDFNRFSCPGGAKAAEEDKIEVDARFCATCLSPSPRGPLSSLLRLLVPPLLPVLLLLLLLEEAAGALDDDATKAGKGRLPVA